MTSLFSFTDILHSIINPFSFIAQYDDEGYPIEDEEWDDELEEDEELLEEDLIDEDVSFDDDEESEWE
jgi:hypothetical protein